MKNVRRNAQIGRTMLLPVALASGFAVTAAHADDDGKRFYIDPMASYTIHDKYRGTDDGIGGQISVGKRLTKGLDLELIGTYTNFSKKSNAPSDSSNATLYGAGLGANVYLAPSSEAFWKGFYIHLDVLRGQGYHSPGAISDYTTTLFDAGLGYKLLLTKEKFGPFAPGIAIRAEALYRHDAHGRGELGESTADNQHQYFQEPAFNLGLHIPLGGRVAPAPPPTPEPEVQVVPVETPPPPPAPEPPPCQPPAPGQPISLEGCKTGDTIILRGVNFEFDKAKLTVNAKTLLDQVADALLARMDIKVEVDGHTDGKGSAPYNLKLSDRRAASVMQYLIGKGVDAGRMTSKGFGKTMPIAPNDTDEGRELNRRVELKIVGDGAGVTVAPADGSAPATAPAEGSAPAPTDSAAPAAAPGDSSAPPPADGSAPSAPAADSSAPAAPDATSTAPSSDSSAPSSSAPSADSSAPSSSTAPSADSTAPAADSTAPK